ncbi:MAG TPA: HEAT repeat domain-containing protein [Gemmatimonadales bacterium]|nr:HEAT repeat domain-containing protein [Gemmatimonadales bacterium]
MRVFRWVPLAVFLAAAAAPLAAQDEAGITTLAEILAAEDARDAGAAVLGRAVNDPDPLVRRIAAQAVGRIADPALASLVLPLLEDPDTVVQTTAVFALGLIRDSANVAPLLGRLGGDRAVAKETAEEAVAALARMGGSQAAEWIGRVLRGVGAPVTPDTLGLLREAAGQAWRLRRDAPAGALVPLLDHEDRDVREGAWYSLAQLRHPALAGRVASWLDDPEPTTRELAARALTPALVKAAAMTNEAAAAILRRAMDDQSPGVRVNALRSLGALRDTASAGRVAARLQDQDPNVRVQAAMTLGELRVPGSAPALENALAPRERWALQREALLALARVDTAAFARAVGSWTTSPEWRRRRAAAQAWTVTAPGAPALHAMLRDPDSRVRAAALQGLVPAGSKPLPEAAEAARLALTQADFTVRAAAAGILRAAASPGDVPRLVAAIRLAERDSSPDAALAALGALRAIADSGGGDGPAVALADGVPRAESYLWRAWAEANWPALAQAWGASYPIATGRTMEDYRGVVRDFLTGAAAATPPRVMIETVERGMLEVELFGSEAPLTVANFLRLVDQRYFDGGTWHRVVPNFVAQDGDPRGDGEGGPGWVIRDEINRRRYSTSGILGMALSGPDTGGSQWFLTHGPAPHLDGTYTVFGRVVGNRSPLGRITQGDVIRAIRR